MPTSPQDRKKEIFSALENGYVQAGLIIFTLILFILTKNVLFGILIALEIFGIVAYEVMRGVKKHGWKEEVKETAGALILAVAILVVAMLVLQSSAPISAVASCSMLPNLDRGDFVIVQGSDINAYSIDMTKAEFGQISKPSTFEQYNQTFPGSLYAYCLQINANEQICNDFVADPTQFKEKHGPLTFHYASCDMKLEDSNILEPCVTAIEYKGKTYKLDKTHDTVVYQPLKEDIYSMIGDIVHRAQFRINVEGQTYYLTKGDNNPIFDVQVYDYQNKIGNVPVSKDRVKGKVVFRVPYLGYLKLFISGLFAEPEQCKTLLGEPITK